MRAIIVDPLNRAVFEHVFPLAPDFMEQISAALGADVLALNVAPPLTAMFVDGIGLLRKNQSFWRMASGKPENNVGGAGILFGLAPDGKLADLPPQITVESLQATIVWAGDTVAKIVDRMVIVDFPGGKAPAVNRMIVWTPGPVVSAASGSAPPAAPALAEHDLYAPASPPAAVSPSPATPMAAATPAAAPALPIAPVWAIHETADNRYRVIEYEVTSAGLGAPLSLSTVANLDAARARVPAGLSMRPAADDTDDDTLVETWS